MLTQGCSGLASRSVAYSTPRQSFLNESFATAVVLGSRADLLISAAAVAYATGAIPPQARP